MSMVTECLWWCCECNRITEVVPCAHCGAAADTVAVVSANAPISFDEVSSDELLRVEDYAWPQEVYA
jgi:hypothetical protein